MKKALSIILIILFSLSFISADYSRTTEDNNLIKNAEDKLIQLMDQNNRTDSFVVSIIEGYIEKNTLDRRSYILLSQLTQSIVIRRDKRYAGCSNECSYEDSNEGNLLTINGEDISLLFSGTDRIGDFGPYGFAIVGPLDPNTKVRIYHAEVVDSRSLEEIINSKVDPAGENRESRQIKGHTVITREGGGMCEFRSFEVLGKKKNISFTTSGCNTNDKEIDYEYFSSLLVERK